MSAQTPLSGDKRMTSDIPLEQNEHNDDTENENQTSLILPGSGRDRCIENKRNTNTMPDQDISIEEQSPINGQKESFSDTMKLSKH